MRKSFLVFIISFFFCLSNAGLAALPAEKQAPLFNRLSKIAEPHGPKVGAAFIDMGSGWEAEINGRQEFPAASVAKVPIMVTAYHLADSGKLNLESKARFTGKDRLGGSGVLQWMPAGKTYTLRNLTRMMIVLSDNSATKMMVDRLGMPTINAYLISSLEARNTIIADPTMLQEPPAPNVNHTTPLDMAHIAAKIEKGEGFSPQARKEMLSYMRNQRYRWGIWRGVPAGTVVADKTGNLEGILNDVGVVYTKQGNYVLSIFTWGFKKQRDARLVINELSKAAYEEYTGEKVPQPVIKKKAPTRRYYRTKSYKKKTAKKKTYYRKHRKVWRSR